MCGESNNKLVCSYLIFVVDPIYIFICSALTLN